MNYNIVNTTNNIKEQEDDTKTFSSKLSHSIKYLPKLYLHY